jgi:hypothetical protein
MSVRDAIPDSVRISGPLATKSDAYIIATLYLDPDVEYPRGILNGAFHDLDRERNSGGPLLVKILESDAVGTSKQAEAAEALSQLPASYSQDALPALLHLAASDNRELRYQVTNALVRIHNERAIPLLIEQIEDESWTADWQRYLCEYGARAIAAENKLMEVSIRASAWPSVAHKTVETLGCIRSTKAIPMLIGLLDAPDWALNIAAAKALGKIGQPTSEVLTALKQLSQNHWSARVKMAAFNALQQLGANPAPVLNISDHVKDDDDPEVLGLPYPFDHGLPWCDDKARYSIDGEKWFTVKWISSTLERVPLGFRPKTDLLIQKIGTQTFLRVRDGWLFGSDGFEGEGVLAHVSNSGVVTEMEAGTGAPFGHASIVRIVRVKDRFFALGSELLKVGHAGVLFELSKSAEGKWTSTRRAILPGPPGVYAIAPTGDLLVSDGPNDYAVIEDQIVPLKCEKTLPGSYFSRH